MKKLRLRVVDPLKTDPGKFYVVVSETKKVMGDLRSRTDWPAVLEFVDSETGKVERVEIVKEEQCPDE